MLLLAGCSAEVVVPVRVGHLTEVTQTFCAPRRATVDVLIVMDGSPSMAQEAALVALNASAIGNMYGRPLLGIDVRIAVVDAQVMQPGCDVPREHAGRFIATSCRERLDDFVTGPSIEGEAADLRAAGCTDPCALDSLVTLPTSIGGDELTPRPWIESIYGVSNLPHGVALGDDLACRMAVGVDGCPFEAPLEAMRAALERASDPVDPAFGFLRPDAALFVLFVTDELDCSMGDVAALAERFDGTTTPTSALCWDEGVRCEGESPYASCWSDDASPLRPVETYAQLLRDIEADKLSRQHDRQSAVFVSVLSGVGSQGEETFADSLDPLRQERFGIGPGCVAAHSEAGPPVRLAELGSEFSAFAPWGTRDAALFSICDSDWMPALACVPGPPEFLPCVDTCFADVDPSTPELEVDCRVEWIEPDGTSHVATPCLDDDPWIPEGETLCTEVVQPADVEYDYCVYSYPPGLPLRFSLPNSALRGCFEVTCAAEVSPTGCPMRDEQDYLPPR